MNIKFYNELQVYYADNKEIMDGNFFLDEITGVKRWLALHRPDYWNVPTFGSSDFKELKDQTQFLLVEMLDGSFTAYRPMVDYSNRTTMSIRDGKLSLVFEGTLRGCDQAETKVLAVAKGQKGIDTVNQLMQKLSQITESFKMRSDKLRPEFMNYIGWCTWDAFYQSVDFSKVKDGLESFKNKGINLGFMILDDGGLDTSDDYLNSFNAYPHKFPGGFSELSKMAKENYGLKMFGLWHAFEGYWTGLNPEGELAKKYGIIENKNVIRPWIKPLKYERLCLVNPESVDDFFNDFYKSLASEGIDMLKVDGQSALELFTNGKLGRADTMKSFQQAMQNAGEKFFGAANIINCMCNGTDVMLNMLTSNVWRNSQDYFPEKPADVQGYHVFCNAYNSVLSSTFSWPDWDMFQSHTAEADFHVVARAISGGPVYVCDKPWQQVADKINSLCLSNGVVPAFDRPGLPTSDVLMEDCYNSRKLLKVSNIKGNIGQIAIFNCFKEGGLISCELRPSDIEELKGDMFAVFEIQSEGVSVLERNQILNVSLDTMQASSFVISPINSGIAAIGLAGKAAAAATFTVIDESTFIFPDKGTAIFYVASRPIKVTANNESLPFEFETGTLKIFIDGPKKIEIEMGD